MTRVILIRHVEAALNVRPELIAGRSNTMPITERGQRQGLAVKKHLDSSDIQADEVYTSGAVRTRETLKLALGARSASGFVVDGRLQEMSQGDFEGRLREEVYTPDVVASIDKLQKSFKLPSGESMDDVAERMSEWLQESAAAYPLGTILAGTHGLAIRCLVGSVKGWSHRRTKDTPTPNGSLTELSVDDGQINVTCFAWDVAKGVQ